MNKIDIIGLCALGAIGSVGLLGLVNASDDRLNVQANIKPIKTLEVRSSAIESCSEAAQTLNKTSVTGWQCTTH